MAKGEATDEERVDKLRKEFLAESFEGLDRMDQCLTELETRPGDRELISEIFRAVHTMKGTTAFLNFARVQRLAHAGEQIIGQLLSGRLGANRELINALLAMMDRVRAVVQRIERTGSETNEGSPEESAAELKEDGRVISRLAVLCGEPTGVPEEGEASGAAGRETARMRTPGTAPGTTPETGASAPEGEPGSDTSDATDATGATASPGQREAGWSAPNESTLRVKVDVLNRLINLVGELVLTRNQMLRRQQEPASLPNLARRLDQVTSDLRETVMQARMQPVGHLFGKLPRMVRDLAQGCGKKVRLELQGQDTGLDKSLLEAVKDPLTHAVRNAVDHGIELPEIRRAAGKPECGTIRLKAFHRNGWVVVEMEDDGAGVSREKVLRKALEGGVVTEEAAARMSDREVLHLIFLPGFSTAGTVTSLSGRGVGMDVVRINVERVGGSVEVQSREGSGTILRMRVPLTLAIIPALIVGSGGHRFCLPQAVLAELVFCPREHVERLVERIGDARLFRLRETLLPMVSLDALLGEWEGKPPRPAAGFYLAVLETEGCRLGLAVDELMDSEEIVVKPLPGGLREIGLFSGATVLGNGGLAMILDVAALAAKAGVRPMLQTEVPEQGAETATGSESQFLIFSGVRPGCPVERMALPLESLERIERVAPGDLHWARGVPRVNHGGEWLRLEDVSGLLETQSVGQLCASGGAAGTAGTAGTAGARDLTALITKPGFLSGGASGERRGMLVSGALAVQAGERLPDEQTRERGTDIDLDRLRLIGGQLTLLGQAAEDAECVR